MRLRALKLAQWRFQNYLEDENIFIWLANMTIVPYVNNQVETMNITLHAEVMARELHKSKTLKRIAELKGRLTHQMYYQQLRVVPESENLY